MSSFGFNDDDDVVIPTTVTTSSTAGGGGMVASSPLMDENQTPLATTLQSTVGKKRIRFEPEHDELEMAVSGGAGDGYVDDDGGEGGGSYGFDDNANMNDEDDDNDFGMNSGGDDRHNKNSSSSGGKGGGGSKLPGEATFMEEEDAAGSLGSMLLYDSVTDVVKLQGTTFLKETIIKVREYSTGDSNNSNGNGGKGGGGGASVVASSGAPEIDEGLWGVDTGGGGGRGGGNRKGGGGGGGVRKGGGSGEKNAIVTDDPEYRFIVECSQLVWKLESEKTRAHLWLVAHYNLCFPELSQLIPSDSVTYAKCVQLIGGNMDLSSIVGDLEEMLPSQLIAVLVACASTTRVGERAFFPVKPTTAMDEATEKLYTDACASGIRRLQAINEACEQITLLEDTKQLFLEYIQHRMPLVCPNLCAFIGAPITSQMFALCGSLTALTRLDPEEVIKLGSRRGNKSGVDIHTSGFLSNCDLVANHAPEMRAKALRLVAGKVVSLARIDDSRRASDDQAGIRARQDVRISMIKWTDPLVHRGAANNTYERLSASAREKRRRSEAMDSQGHFGQNKATTGVVQHGV